MNNKAAPASGSVSETNRREALLKTGALQTAIFNSANFSSIATDARGVIQIFNVGAERMLGYAAAEIMNKLTPADISDPQEVIARAKALSDELQTPIAPGFEALVFKATRGIEDIYELTYIRKDGTRFPAVVSVTALRDAQGAIIGYLLIGTDNTARKQVEAQLRYSNERIAVATESAGIGTWECDLASNNLTWDNRTYQAHGITRASCGADLHALWVASLHPEDRQRCEGEIAAALRGEKEFDSEYRVVRQDGEVRYLKAAARTMRGADGSVAGLTGVNFDITERRRAEEELLKAGALQRAIFNSANFSSIATDAKGVIQIFNVGAERMLGYAAADVMNKITPADISDPEEVIARAKALSDELHTPIAPGFEALVFKATRGIEDIYELTYIRKDGTRFPAVVSVTALRDAQDAIIGFLLIGTDNTARKQIEAEQKQLGQRLRDHQFYTRSLFEANIDALMTTDAPGIITDVNKQMEALTGRTRDELIGAPFKDYFTDPGRAEAGIRLVLSEKKVTDYELTARDRDGKETVVSYNATTFYDRDRKLQGVFAAARDITARKHLEDSLRDAMYKAKQASRAKTQFLANMSHEIRTPMNAVVGLAYLLGRTPLDDEQTAFLSKLKIASKSLLAVINDVLDLSKIEAGELTLERTVFSPRDLLDALADMMEPQASAKGIAFAIDMADDLPAALEGDATRLTQILINLLSNAIKFTEIGSVRLRVRRISESAKGVALRFDVRDSGIGIAPDVQARLFAPFAQADASITRRFGGTGLGLSIVKRLVNLMGGEVSLESTPGVGSEFTVDLDFAPASPDLLAHPGVVSAAPNERALAGVRVLVVDDSEINLDVAKRILELEGAQVALASNGMEAFDRVRTQPDAFDVVLMDVQMPLLDGHEATRLIRGQLHLTHLPIIALTAGAMTSERHQVITSGMDDFLSKPFDPQNLVATILRHVKIDRRAAAQTSQGPPAALPSEAPSWPEIDGVDGADVRERLGGDVDLFRSLLRRLLDEFIDIAIPGQDADPLWLMGQAKRMHKLKGCAGMLGAKSIQLLAGKAEAACAAGEPLQAAPLATDLAGQLQRLRMHCATLLAQAPTDIAEPCGSGDAAIAPQELDEFLALLRERSLFAVERFNALAPRLGGLLDRDAYARFRQQMDDLKFGDAASTLEALR